jgi:hypothetical protein
MSPSSDSPLPGACASTLRVSSYSACQRCLIPPPLEINVLGVVLARERRHVVERRLDRRVGENAAVPIKITVDPYGRKGRWKRAGCHYMTNRQRAFAAIEIVHLTGLHFCGSDRDTAVALHSIDSDWTSSSSVRASGSVE